MAGSIGRFDLVMIVANVGFLRGITNMAGSINRVILVGNVTADPRITTLNSGDIVASFSLATSETWKDKQTGERKEKAEFHNVAVFNPGLAGVVRDYVKKGSKLYVEGQLQTRKYTDKEGVERYTTEIVLQKFNGEIVLLSNVSASGG